MKFVKIITTTIISVVLFCSVALASDITLWNDWPKGIDEEAGLSLRENKLMLGYNDQVFGSYQPITEQQVIRVCKRADIRTDLNEGDYAPTPVPMYWVEKFFLPGTVFTAGPNETCTRFRFAVMVYRYMQSDLKKPHSSSVPDRYVYYESLLNEWFDETYVTWNGTKRQTKLVGKARLLIDQSLDRKIPLWLALGQGWRESQWFTTGLSVNYNCGWGIKASPSKWGELGNPATVSGFGNYVSVDEAIRAYYKYMDEQTGSKGSLLYRHLIDTKQWKKILDIYAPPYENNSTQHYNIVMEIKRKCESRGIFL